MFVGKYLSENIIKYIDNEKGGEIENVGNYLIILSCSFIWYFKIATHCVAN